MPRGSNTQSPLFGPRKVKTGQGDLALILFNRNKKNHNNPEATSRIYSSIIKGAEYKNQVVQLDPSGNKYEYYETCIPHIGFKLEGDQWIWHAFITRQESGLLSAYKGNSFESAKRALIEKAAALVDKDNRKVVLDSLNKFSYKRVLKDMNPTALARRGTFSDNYFVLQSIGALPHALIRGGDGNKSARTLFRCFPPESFRDKGAEGELREKIIDKLITDWLSSYFRQGENQGEGQSQVLSLRDTMWGCNKWFEEQGDTYKGRSSLYETKIVKRASEYLTSSLENYTDQGTPYYMIDFNALAKEKTDLAFREELAEILLKDEENIFLNYLTDTHLKPYPDKPLASLIQRGDLVQALTAWQEPTLLSDTLKNKLTVVL